MRIDFEPGERERFARQLGVADDEAALSAAVEQRLRAAARDPGDMSDIDAAFPHDRAEALRQKQARIAAAVAAKRRRDYTPSDDDRPFGYEDDDSYNPDWLTAAEQRKREEQRLEAQAARQGSGSSIVGFQPKVQARKAEPGRVSWGSGKVTRPSGDWGQR